jgi:hypothetical protein
VTDGCAHALRVPSFSFKLLSLARVRLTSLDSDPVRPPDAVPFAHDVACREPPGPGRDRGGAPRRRQHGAGCRYAAQQVNQAYVLLLSAQFQRFCRDLHTECVDHLASGLGPATIRTIFRRQLRLGRKLDTGNPNPGNIGSDFDRFEMSFWPAVLALDPQNRMRQSLLVTMNQWRNAVAHQDFSRAELGGRNQLTLAEVRRWRSACERLVVDFERVMHHYLSTITGTAPW